MGGLLFHRGKKKGVKFEIGEKECLNLPEPGGVQDLDYQRGVRGFIIIEKVRGERKTFTDF